MAFVGQQDPFEQTIQLESLVVPYPLFFCVEQLAPEVELSAAGTGTGFVISKSGIL